MMLNRIEKQAIGILGSVFALRMIGLFMIIPVISVYGHIYVGATPLLLGLAVGVYGVMQALFQIPMSVMADRFPRKPLIILGLLLFAIGGCVAASSHHVYGLIAGRAIAGVGAISAVCMALLSDLTREQNRNVAMAAMGLSIALSFNVAFGVGPVLTAYVGFKGLFLVSAGVALCAAVLVLLLPNASRVLPQFTTPVPTMLKRVLQQPALNQLHVSIFILHFLVSIIFVALPVQLIQILHLKPVEFGYLYLALLLFGFCAAVPAIIMAEKYKKMRRVFQVAVGAMVFAFVVLALVGAQPIGFVVGLAVFFIGFNVLEAILPSWLSKVAPIYEKSTAMGVNSTAQFLGAGLGAIVAGVLLSYALPFWMFWCVLGSLGALWWCIVLLMQEPPYFTTYVVPLLEHITLPDTTRLLHMPGIKDVVMLDAHRVLYVKVDKSNFTDDARHLLSQMSKEVLNF